MIGGGFSRGVGALGAFTGGLARLAGEFGLGLGPGPRFSALAVEIGLASLGRGVGLGALVLAANFFGGQGSSASRGNVGLHGRFPGGAFRGERGLLGFLGALALFVRVFLFQVFLRLFFGFAGGFLFLLTTFFLRLTKLLLLQAGFLLRLETLGFFSLPVFQFLRRNIIQILMADDKRGRRAHVAADHFQIGFLRFPLGLKENLLAQSAEGARLGSGFSLLQIRDLRPGDIADPAE